MKNTKAFERIANTTAPYFEAEQELVERVRFAQEVIANTLRKFPASDRPAELAWALSTGRNARITGFEFQYENGNSANGSIQQGLEPLGEKHFLTFYVIGTVNWRSDELKVQKVRIPAELLMKDPMAIAQYARKLIRAKQAERRYAEAREATRKVEELNKKLETMEKERAKLEAERTEIAARNKREREAAEKNKAKRDKRKAAKLVKSQANS